MQATAQPIKTHVVQPSVENDTASQRPTETRYGWCPFDNINLTGPDGTPNLYVQPHQIEDGFGGNVPNPYHKSLPKGQLIPFPTFNLIEQQPSPDLKDHEGRAVLVSSTRTLTALEAAVMVLRRHSPWGFMILNSLQGLDQDTAVRIFQVVQPLEYPMGMLVGELEFGAYSRIESTEPITFETVPGYVVEPLRNDLERSIATQLVEEMLGGANAAYIYANEVLDGTETSMTTRFAGGSGKTGPDQLDRRLSAELDRDLPTLTGNKTTDLDNKLNYLVGREASREDKEEIESLKRELAELRSSQQQEPTPTTAVITCGAVKSDGTMCKSIVANYGDGCRHHPNQGMN